MTRSWDITIDGEPYMFEAEGIVLGDALTEPAPPTELGSAVIENISTGLGPKVNRGNGYYDIHRLIPTVEGQLIFNPTIDIGAAHTLPGGSEYTPGVFHHPVGNAGAQYIAYGKRIYAIFLTDILALSYTDLPTSDPTAAPISNADARYTGGSFVWRNRVYFGIENRLNGEAIGYAYIDLAVSPTTVTLKDDTFGKAFSFAASARGRLFLARNKSNVIGLDPIELKWSPDMDHNYDDDVTPFAIYGDTGTFIYGIENRPRVTWVTMIGSAAIFHLEHGGALASDEAGFTGIIAGPAQASAAGDNFQGFGAVPYLDGIAFRVGFGGPLHLNPVTLVTRSLSPGNLQDLTLENNDVTIYCMTSVGEHLLYAGSRYLYEIVWTGNAPVLHKHLDFSQFVDLATYIPGAMSYQGGLLVITFVSTALGSFRQVQIEPMPSINVSTNAVSGVSRTGWIDTGILIGPSRAAHMTKLWLQVRGAHYMQAEAPNTLSFSNALVDESKSVSIASITSGGPWASAITASPHLNRLGRTLSFRLNVNVEGYTGFNERVFTPIVADFVWCPTNTDMLTLKIRCGAEQEMRVGGAQVRYSAREYADLLLSKNRGVITVEFSDGSPTPQTWTMFVERVDAARSEPVDAYGQWPYVVQMACRRLS